MRWMLALLVPTVAIAGSMVEGRVIDQGGYVVSNVVVRFLLGGAGDVKYRTETDSRDVFQIEDVAAGDYIIRVNHPAFSEGSIRITVTDRSLTKAGNIVLPLLPCDAPGVHCDDFGTVPQPTDLAPIRGGLGLRVGCAIDLDTGAQSCETSPTADLKFIAGDHGTRYLELTNGAKLCEGADQRIRVDALGGGNHWCIITNAKHRSQVYINLKVVEPGAESIGLFFMTR